MIHFDIASLEDMLKKNSSLMAADDFWENPKEATKISREFNEVKDKLDTLNKLNKDINDIKDCLVLLDETGDLEFHQLADNNLTKLCNELDTFKLSVLFTDEYDHLNAILEFHPGAGGTESQDWADMLYRMYVRFAEDKRFKMAVIDYQSGDVAGLKSATIAIRGHNAYGYLKGEKGVHRLVRISPFDSQGRRHTSFASVNVVPEFDESIEIDLNEKDIKVDTYRSSGAGGQNVNKTDSAVRMTHLPTGIVVSSQIEKSQIQNRAICMNMLKSHLLQLKIEERKNKLNKIVGEQKNIEWGSQIRSYVFCPYTMVKDHRTDYSEVNVGEVMNGKIDNFLTAYLELEAKKHG